MTPLPAPLPPTSEEGVRARTRGRERRAVLWGIGISALLHLVGIWLYPGFVGRVPEVRVLSTPTPMELPLRGIEIVTMREQEDAPRASEEDRPPEVILDLPEPLLTETPSPLALPSPSPLPRTGEGARAQVAEEPRLSAAERLRPRMGDPRLWAPLDRSILDLSEQERAELYLRGMIRDWNDSVAVAVALSDQATDWTYTDDEGRRWGLSPGRLHLGDFSIPLPLSFQLPPGRRDEAARVSWEMRDILRGSATAEIRRSWAERAREIRERMEAERAQAAGAPRVPGGD